MRLAAERRCQSRQAGTATVVQEGGPGFRNTHRIHTGSTFSAIARHCCSQALIATQSEQRFQHFVGAAHFEIVVLVAPFRLVRGLTPEQSRNASDPGVVEFGSVETCARTLEQNYGPREPRRCRCSHSIDRG